jgi:uncharacterized membrane protein YsdA (DUF1294 family)/cold shock CspA family protein
MRRKGKMTYWDDDKGYGFVTWPGNDSDLFVHIKRFERRPRRPVIGDIVTYEVAPGRGGKAQAVNVRFERNRPGRSQLRTGRVGGRGHLVVPLLVAGLFSLAWASDLLPGWLLATYAGMSALTYLVYALDKSAAVHGKARTPEATLHLMGLLGGWPGGWVAQRSLRHKSSKRSFLVVFRATVLVNLLVLSILLLDDEPGWLLETLRSG